MEPTERYLDDCIWLYRAYFSPKRSQQIYPTLQEEIEWLHRYYDNPDGRRVYLPRLTANYGDFSYDYSGLRFTPKPWTPLLRELKTDAEQLAQQTFNSLILQQYRDGQDGVNWHSDSDPAVGLNPTLVSMSFGATRSFWLRAKAQKEPRTELQLHSGDVLIMRRDLQHTHVHKVPKEDVREARINLTFRHIRSAS
ncbi:MAG: alpha-ketoglutarate-dependent dioxygenase AlkB [Myxococcota bacterium]